MLLPVPTLPAVQRQCPLARSVAAYAAEGKHSLLLSRLVFILASISLLAIISNQGRELLLAGTALGCDLRLLL